MMDAPLLLLAQQTTAQVAQTTASPPPADAAPSWLQGVITIPGPLLAALAGALILGGLLYFARQASRPKRERALEDELR